MPLRDPEARRAYAAAYYRANREKRRAQVKAWQDANPERVRESKRNSERRRHGHAPRAAAAPEDERRAAARAATRKYQAQPHVRAARAETQRVRNARRRTAAVVEDVHPLVVLELADGVCGICGGDVDPLDFHVDHVIPLALGGEHSYMNTQPAHAVCNIRKGAAL